jgi:DNA-binding NarL/FixJ family response regulator
MADCSATLAHAQRQAILWGNASEIAETVAELRHDSAFDITLCPDFAAVCGALSRQEFCLILTTPETVRWSDWVELRKHRQRSGVLLVAADLPVDRQAAWLRMGAHGFLRPGCPGAVLAKAYDCARRGELWVERRALSQVVQSMVAVMEEHRFTPRELDIFSRVSAGQNNRQIAEALCITRETVRWHLRSAYNKLGVHDRRAAANRLFP